MTTDKYKFKYQCIRTLDIYETQKLIDKFGNNSIQLYNLNLCIWLLKHANKSSLKLVKDNYKYKRYVICSRCLCNIHFFGESDICKEQTIHYHQTRTINGRNFCDVKYEELLEECNKILTKMDNKSFFNKRLLKQLHYIRHTADIPHNLALTIGLVEENRFLLNNYIDII